MSFSFLTGNTIINSSVNAMNMSNSTANSSNLNSSTVNNSNIQTATLHNVTAFNVTIINTTLNNIQLSDVILINSRLLANCTTIINRNAVIKGPLDCQEKIAPVISSSGISITYEDAVIMGNMSGIGINVSGRENLTIKGCAVSNFSTAIKTLSSKSINLLDLQALNSSKA